MMTTLRKKGLVLLLALALLLSTAGMAGAADFTFPPAERTTVRAMMLTPARSFEDYLEKCQFYAKMAEETNVDLEWIYLGDSANATTMLNALFAAGNEGDIILGRFLNESFVSDLIAAGLIQPLNDYIDDLSITPNLNARIFDSNPQVRGFITAYDGNIYQLPKYTALDGNYLESPLWINGQWLEQVGMDVPTTIDEFTEVLRAFKAADLNGNGDANDEIPLIMSSGNAFAHMEALLGVWGMPTKDSALDSYVMIEDGVVKFVPTMDAYKEAIKTYNLWYAEGLLWSECFTASQETFTAKLTTESCVVGAITTKTPPVSNYADAYVLVPPLTVDGYTPNWYRHPGALGTKGYVTLTTKAQNPEIAIAWSDTLYSLEYSIESQYGLEPEGRWEMVDGKYNFLPLDAATTEAMNESNPTFLSFFGLNLHSAINSEDYADSIVLSAVQAQYQANYEVYKDSMNNEIWPRPYFTEEDTNRMNELRTDIFTLVQMKRAAWVTGTADIDADWDSFVKQLNAMGLEEFIDIMQRTYDIFLEGM